MTDDGPHRRLADADLDEAEFELLYGPLARLRPDEAAALLDPFNAGSTPNRRLSLQTPRVESEIGAVARRG